jgi:hypothetical protein
MKMPGVDRHDPQEKGWGPICALIADIQCRA